MTSEVIARADITDYSSVEVCLLDNGDYRMEWSLVSATIRHTTSVRLTGPALLATRDAIDGIAAKIAATRTDKGETK